MDGEQRREGEKEACPVFLMLVKPPSFSERGINIRIFLPFVRLSIYLSICLSPSMIEDTFKKISSLGRIRKVPRVQIFAFNRVRVRRIELAMNTLGAKAKQSYKAYGQVLRREGTSTKRQLVNVGRGARHRVTFVQDSFPHHQGGILRFVHCQRLISCRRVSSRSSILGCACRWPPR